MDYCERNRMAFIPWFPLGAGTVAAKVLDRIAKGPPGETYSGRTGVVAETVAGHAAYSRHFVDRPP